MQHDLKLNKPVSDEGLKAERSTTKLYLSDRHDVNRRDQSSTKNQTQKSNLSGDQQLETPSCSYGRCRAAPGRKLWETMRLLLR